MQVIIDEVGYVEALIPENDRDHGWSFSSESTSGVLTDEEGAVLTFAYGVSPDVQGMRVVVVLNDVERNLRWLAIDGNEDDTPTDVVSRAVNEILALSRP